VFCNSSRGFTRYWEGDLRGVLRDCPEDRDIWRYLGKARDIGGKHGRARAAYRHARRLSAREPKDVPVVPRSASR
jgi:hypothetical protein